jgi:hypothetical protein
MLAKYTRSATKCKVWQFSLNPRFGFNETNAFSQAWRGVDVPRFIGVTLRHPCPYFDDSYAVNSANCGPYGDAVHREWMAKIEKRFRCIPESYARVVTGGSTGGWIFVALQVWYPTVPLTLFGPFFQGLRQQHAAIM